jgi:excisionase family DNA binding protein
MDGTKGAESGLPTTLTVEQAAKLLRISRGLAYEAARRGEIPTIRLGRRVLVPRAKLLALLGEQDTPS